MRKTFAVLLALAALSAPANAQQRGPDRGPGPGQQQQQHGPDRNDPGPGSRNDQFYHHRDASQADLNAADARLNRVYQQRITEAQFADRGRHPRGWYGQEAALRAAERAWIAYRDADCRYAAQSQFGARAYQNVIRACLIDRTNERLATLQDARTQWGGR